MKPEAKKIATILSSYGLRRLPFTKEIEPEEVFHTDQFDRGLDALRYLVDRRGLGTLIAPPGLGKTVLLRVFLNELNANTHWIAYIAHTTCGVLDLYREIAFAFGLAPLFRKPDLHRQIKDRLRELWQAKRLRPVLVIDEGHLLSRTFLDEIRILANFDADSRDDITLLLAGQPQLRYNLHLAINEALAQRIFVRVVLDCYGRKECDDYIVHRLARAGRTAPLFTEDGLEAMFRASRGIPRLLDVVGDRALLLAVDAKAKQIDADLVQTAAQALDP